MECDWETLPIAEAPLEIIDGDRGSNYPKQDEFAPTGHCLFLNTGNVTTTGFEFAGCSFITKQKDEVLRKGKLRRHDVVLTTRGTVGNVALFNDSVPFEHIRINSGMVLLRPDHTKLIPRFLYLFVRSPEFKRQVSSLSTGSAQPQLPIRDIRRVLIQLPPLSEQDAIANILGSLDDKIELNRRMNETLEAMARALFKSWFIDFDPVRAKADGREPEGMDEVRAELFPDSFEESELGPVPRGWRVKSLPEAYEVNPYRQLAKESVAPYLDMQGMPTTGHRPSNWIQRPFGSGMKFTNGDTLVARITPCLENGKTAYVDFLSDNEVGWGSTEYIVLRPKSPLPSEHGYFLARTEEFRSFAIQNMTGTSGRQRVPSTCFANYPLVIPDGEVAHRFGLFAGAQMKAISRNSEEASTLAQIRDCLLPKLLSGELRIKDAERVVEAAL